MTRLSKFQTKIALSFCTLFCLYFPTAFSQQVDTAWVRRYNGPGNGSDSAVAVAVDSNGSVYVTGSSFDNTTGYDYCTIKYLPSGDTAWVRRYNGPLNGDDFAYAMALGPEGNVYVTGSGSGVFGSGSVGDYVTIKYDSDGNQKWVARIHNIFTRQGDGAFAIVVDQKENIYVTGEMSDPGEGTPGWLTAKYDSSGNELWNRAYFNNGTGRAIRVDSEGNVYVTGKSATVKYDSLGNRRWIQSFSGEARAVALDMNGNVYATGAVIGSPGYTTVKLDSGGNQLWNRLYGTCQGGSAQPLALFTDKQNNVYITGQLWYCEDFMGITVKYDSLGNLLWDNGHFRMKKVNAITVDTNGNCYVAGAGSNYTFSTVKYDSTGQEVWLKASFYGEAAALNLDPHGNVYVTGSAGTDFATIKYSPLPQVKGDLNLDGILNLNDVVFALNCTFLGEAPPAAPAACNINCDGKVTAVDVVILLLMVFLFAPAPC